MRREVVRGDAVRREAVRGDAVIATGSVTRDDGRMGRCDERWCEESRCDERRCEETPSGLQEVSLEAMDGGPGVDPGVYPGARRQRLDCKFCTLQILYSANFVLCKFCTLQLSL